VIAIDGKALRRSYRKKGAKAPIDMVSAFAARQRLVLGQIKVAEKSNEIVAIVKLLDLLAIEGAIEASTLSVVGATSPRKSSTGRLPPRPQSQST
jgi:hypothetical protein